MEENIDFPRGKPKNPNKNHDAFPMGNLCRGFNFAPPQKGKIFAKKILFNKNKKDPPRVSPIFGGAPQIPFFFGGGARGWGPGKKKNFPKRKTPRPFVKKVYEKNPHLGPAFDSIMVFRPFKTTSCPTRCICSMSILSATMRKEFGGCGGNIAYNFIYSVPTPSPRHRRRRFSLYELDGIYHINTAYKSN
ncbi:MAG: hypothetical protein H0A76_12765 [Candidatus Thiodubiliella endoseptemdiera]|uniref:Uncharacterized protein n=1 Tax=Candidatus Thiodubiliella endoseptemdiera TaxID=2738886 RepID=A0A853F4R8_9GAMM|nr:hypothetical protein [Candidatus Thiodubiliella endoseptemdiera]